MAGKRPDFNVSFVMRGDDSRKGQIGVGWKSDDYEETGRISIKLNPMVRLDWDPDLFITLFPIEYDKDGNRVMKERGNNKRKIHRSDDDEIPF